MANACVIFLIGKPKAGSGKLFKNFWHVAVLYQGKVYETFSNGKWFITDYTKWKYKDEPKVMICDVKIDEVKLKSEVRSGTDCATYVARVIGMDNKTEGEEKNTNIYPHHVLDWLLIYSDKAIYSDSNQILQMEPDNEWLEVVKVDKYEYCREKKNDSYVAVIPIMITKDGVKVLVRTEYHPVAGKFLTIITGGVEDGEDPMAAAKRELKEESGYDAKSMIKLGDGYLTKASYNKTYVYLAILDEKSFSEPTGDGTELEKIATNSLLDLTPELISKIYESKDFIIKAVFFMFLTYLEKRGGHNG